MSNSLHYDITSNAYLLSDYDVFNSLGAEIINIQITPRILIHEVNLFDNLIHSGDYRRKCRLLSTFYGPRGVCVEEWRNFCSFECNTLIAVAFETLCKSHTRKKIT